MNISTAKGTNVAAYNKESGALAPLFNPREQNWDDHFAIRGMLIVGKSLSSS
jgi:hypothetical protein